MRDIILQHLEASVSLTSGFIIDHAVRIEDTAKLLAETLNSGAKVLIFGNGGSAADAQHIAAELVNRFQVDRTPLAAVALTTDTSIITAVANDFDFKEIFAKQVRAIGRENDLAWGISTSGNSINVIRGLKQARQQGLKTLGLTGGSGGGMAAHCDIALCVAGGTTPRIQEVHITVAHILCDLVDRILFPEKFNRLKAEGD